MSLSPEKIQDLLAKQQNKTRSTIAPYTAAATLRIQSGPLRWFDTEMRCTSRNCNSSTYCRVQNMPLCMMHSLLKLNQLLTKDDQ